MEQNTKCVCGHPLSDHQSIEVAPVDYKGPWETCGPAGPDACLCGKFRPVEVAKPEQPKAAELSRYDSQEPQAGDPLPVEGVELTQQQLTNLRIQLDVDVTRSQVGACEDAWRKAFNNLAGNVRNILNSFDQRLAKQEGELRLLRTQLKAAKKARKGAL